MQRLSNKQLGKRQRQRQTDSSAPVQFATISLAVLCSIGLLMTSTPAASAVDPIPVRLLTDSRGQLTAQMGTKSISAGDLQQRQDSSQIHRDATFASTAANELTITATSANLLLQADLFPGWSATLIQGNQASIHIRPQTQSLSLITPPINSSPVQIQLPDGAEASAQHSSILRLDLFKDQSYSLSGQGQITAKNADGKEVALDSYLQPLTGGPLIRVPGPNGQPRLARVSPTVEMTIKGLPGSTLTLCAPGLTFQLEGDETQQISLPNGALLQVRQNLQHQSLQWLVIKGQFLFIVHGLSAWEALGWTDQAAELTWDIDRQAVDLTNLGTNSPLMVALPNQTVASVSPQATLQFAQLNSTTFAASASGGNINVYNAVTHRHTQLGHGQLQFKQGVTSSHSSTLRNSITLRSTEFSTLEISSDSRTSLLTPAEETIVNGADDSQLQVSLTFDGRVYIESLSGHHSIHLTPEHNLTVDLPEGNALEWALTPLGHAFQAHAPAANPTTVGLTAGAGVTMSLAPDQEILLVLPPSESARNFWAGAVYRKALQPAGSSTPSPALEVAPDQTFGSGSFARDPTEIYGPRISQPPVSVVR